MSINNNNTAGERDRGFGSMDDDKQREIASEGGKQSGGNFGNDRERASEAGRKGGQQSGEGRERSGQSDNGGRQRQQQDDEDQNAGNPRRGSSR